MSVREFRRALVRYAHERWESVSPFLTKDFQTFRSLIGEGDKWGGELELRLASDMVGRDIRVFNVQSGTWTRYIPEAHAPHSSMFFVLRPQPIQCFAHWLIHRTIRLSTNASAYSESNCG